MQFKNQGKSFLPNIESWCNLKAVTRILNIHWKFNRFLNHLNCKKNSVTLTRIIYIFTLILINGNILHIIQVYFGTASV